MKITWMKNIWVGAMVTLMAGLQSQAASYLFDNDGTTEGFGVVDGGSYDWWAGARWTTNNLGGAGVLATWPNGSNQAFFRGAGAGTTYKVRLGSDGTTNATLQNFAINVTVDAASASGEGNVTIGDAGDTGTLTINANNSVGAQSGGTLTVNNPINLNAKTFNFRGGNVVLNGVVSGTGASKFVLASGAFGLSAGTLTLANTANTYAGRVNSDYLTSTYTLVVTKLADGGSSSSIGTSSANIGLNGGRLKFVGTGAQNSNLGLHIGSGGAIIEAAGSTAADTITFSGAPTYSAADSARAITVTGSNAGANTLAFNYGNNGTGVNTFTKDGNGTWVLSGSNSFTGTLNINAGALVVARTNALGLANRIVNLGTATTTGTVVFATDNVAMPYVLNVGSGSSGAVQVGRGTSGAALTYKTGTSTLGNGTLFVQAGPNVSSGTPVLEFAGITMSAGAAGLSTGTMLEPTTADVLVSGNITRSGSLANRLTLAGTSTGNLISGIISGPQVLYKAGAGSWTLSAANTFTGVTTIAGGTLKITHNQALQNSPLDTVFTGGGVLDLTGVNAPVIGGLTNNAAFVLPSNVTALTLNPSGSVSYSGSISGGASGLTLTKSGTGTQVLSAGNSYSGLTTVSGGALRIQHAAALGTTDAGVTVASGARVELVGLTVSGETITVNGAGGNYWGGLQSASGTSEWQGPVTIGSELTRIGVSTGTFTVSGVIDSGANLFGVMFRPDSGTLILSATNTYLGDTGIVCGSGVVKLSGGANRLPVTTKLIFGASSVSGLLDLNGQDQEVVGLSVNSGTANEIKSVAALATLTVNTTNGAPSTFSGKIAQKVVLVKTGVESLTLSGANTYNGGTVVSNGTLVLAGATAGGTGALTVANGATCTVTSASSAIADTATVSLGASGVMNLDAGVTETVRCLYINGMQQGAGVWNAARDPARFSGSGSLVVLVGNATRISFF